LSKFHESLGIGKPATEEEKEDLSKSLLESVGEYIAGKQFLSNVRQYYQTIARSEVHEELQQARNQLETINEEVSRALTQSMILRKRQADLGAYIEQSISTNNRNPTVEDLVLTEDDRLSLLEHRLKRIIEKLKKQKTEIELFITLHGIMFCIHSHLQSLVLEFHRLKLLLKEKYIYLRHNFTQLFL